MVGHRTAVFVGMCAALGCAEPQAGLIRQHLGGLPPADTGGREVFHTEDYSGSPALKIYLAGQDALASTDPDGAAVVLDDLYVLDASHAWLYDGIMYTGGGLERACTPVATVDTAATSGWSCLSVDDTSGLGNTIGILTGDSYSEFLGTATVDPSNTTATSLCIYGTKSFAVPVNAQAIDIFPLAKTFNVYSSGIIVDSVLFGELKGGGKAVALGETDGFVKVVADKASGEILGVHIVGPEATEIIHEFAVGRTLEATVEEIMHTIHAHPTLSEAALEATLATLGQAIHI